MSEGNLLMRELSESCRAAIEERQDERPQAELVAVHGDWAYVSIGEVRPAHINDVFDEDRVTRSSEFRPRSRRARTPTAS